MAAMPTSTLFHQLFCRNGRPIIWNSRFRPDAFSPWLEFSSQRHTTPDATNDTAIGNR